MNLPVFLEYILILLCFQPKYSCLLDKNLSQNQLYPQFGEIETVFINIYSTIH